MGILLTVINLEHTPPMYNSVLVHYFIFIIIGFASLSSSKNINNKIPYQLRCTKTNLLERNVFDTYQNENSFKNSIQFLNSGKFTFDNYLHYLKSRDHWQNIDYSRKNGIENSLEKYVQSLDFD